MTDDLLARIESLPWQGIDSREFTCVDPESGNQLSVRPRMTKAYSGARLYVERGEKQLGSYIGPEVDRLYDRLFNEYLDNLV